MHMELIMITGEMSPGLIQRVIIELGRRGIESEKMFMIHEGDKTKIIIEADIGKMNGRLPHALMGPQDVELAEHLREDSCCFWKVMTVPLESRNSLKNTSANIKNVKTNR